MSYYYPQACLKLRILLEDFKLISDASLQRPYEIVVVAKDFTINVGDHKTTDSFTAEIDYKNFPFDPRAIRSCAVVAYIQDMKSIYREDGSLNTIVPKDENAVFAGFVDTDEVTLDDSNQIVRLEGRDFTALLIDQKYDESGPIDQGRPIDQSITSFLAKFKATQQLTVINKTGGTLPTLAQYYPGFGQSHLAGQRNTGTHESYWDIISDMVHKAGLICYIHLSSLVITTPRNLYGTNSDIKFVYGQNIKMLTWKRKLGRLKNFNILVRSRSGKEVIEAKIPEEATPEWCKSFGIQRAQAQVPVLKPDGSLDNTTLHPAPYVSFPIPNISNKDQLIRIGQTVYEDYSRQQLEGSLETYEMLGHSGADERDPSYKVYDLTQLDIGQPLCIEIEKDDLAQISRLRTVGERRHHLEVRGYSPELAAIFAKTLGKFSPRFYTKGYTLSLNQDTGYKLKIEFINIIETTFKNL
jgi:hypothetical protein